MKNINIDYFNKIDTEDKAYLLGYLLADGYITKNRLSVSSIDKDRIELFREKLESEHRISISSNRNAFDNVRLVNIKVSRSK